MKELGEVYEKNSRKRRIEEEVILIIKCILFSFLILNCFIPFSFHFFSYYFISISFFYFVQNVGFIETQIQLSV